MDHVPVKVYIANILGVFFFYSMCGLHMCVCMRAHMCVATIVFMYTLAPM